MLAETSFVPFPQVLSQRMALTYIFISFMFIILQPYYLITGSLQVLKKSLSEITFVQIYNK